MISRQNYTLAIKNAAKAAAQDLINNNPAVWGVSGLSRVFNSKYRNSQNHVWWVSHGPLKNTQYNSIVANATAAGWLDDGTLLIAADREKEPHVALAEWGLTPEPVEE